MSQVTRSSLRFARLLAVGATAVSSFVPAAAYAAGPLTLAPPPVQDEDRAGDHLTVTVSHTGNGALDGTYELYCHPGGGDHPDAAAACDALDRGTRWGTDTFAPVPEGSVCTMQYGGPATARVTGTWAGRPVDASYDRGDGCEIARWGRLVPLLPDLRPRERM